jgi:hypothetical protein
MTGRGTGDAGPDDFTMAFFRRLVRLARERYPFVSFPEAPHRDHWILWRHDVDASPQRARALARIEGEEGVTATYFIQLGSPFYNPFEGEIRAIQGEIRSLGHRIGLHFDPAPDGVADAARLEERLAFQRGILEDLTGGPVEAFSFHNPGAATAAFAETTYAGMVNAYAPLLTREADYCSDSNGYWRHRPLAEVLRDDTVRRLQVLTHPEWWTEEPLPPRERIIRCVRGRADRVMAWYDGFLRAHGRENLGG